MYYADTDDTHSGWEAQRGIRTANENQAMQMNPLKKMMESIGISLEELRGRGRQQKLVDARSLVAAVLMSQPFTRQQDVAELLGISQSAVSHLLKRHRELMEVDEVYKRKGEEFLSDLNNKNFRANGIRSCFISDYKE